MNGTAFPIIDMKATGTNILALRKSKGLSVTDLQEYFGFEAPQAIYKWQKGQSLPSTDNLFALSFLLGVPIDSILIPHRNTAMILPQDDSCGNNFSIPFSNSNINAIIIFGQSIQATVRSYRGDNQQAVA